MLGFLIGTLCLIGLIKVLRHGHGWGWGWGHGGGFGRGCGGGPHGHGFHGGWAHEGWPPHGGFGPHGGHGFGPRAFVQMLLERLDTTPGQEKVIFQAFDELREAMRDARHAFRRSRGDVAAAFAGEHFDAEAMGAVFSRHDDAIASVRKAVVGAMAKVHDALDERQRRAFAELLETRGGFGFGGGFGRGGGFGGGFGRGGGFGGGFGGGGGFGDGGGWGPPRW